MNRTVSAINAFRQKNTQQIQKLHTPEEISRGLAEEHVDFSLSDIILGGQDGLVNVLGVILGVAAASNDTRLILAAGLAAAFAESISMAAVAFTTTRAESEHYQAELGREQWEIEHNPQGEVEEIRQIYQKRGFSGQLLEEVVETITKNKKVWLEVMMAEELKLTPIKKHQAVKSAIIVGISAIIGSIIPLIPFFIAQIQTAIMISLIISGLTLFVVGAYKARVTVGTWYKSGVELTVIGLISAFVGYAIGFLFKVPIVP